MSQAASQQPANARPPRIPRALRLIQNIVGSVVVVAFIYYLVTHRTEAQELLRASAGDLAILTLLVCVTLSLNWIQNLALIRGLGVKVTWTEAFFLTFATNFGNYLPIRAGTLIVAQYLKSVHGLPYARFGSLFGVRLLITLFGIGLLGAAATLFIWASLGRLSVGLLFMFSSLLAGATVLWFIPLPRPTRESGRLRHIINDLVQNAARLRGNPALGSLVLTSIVLQQATLVARFYFGARAMGNEVPLGHLLLLSPVASLASIAALTPGSLGLREAAMGAATYAIGATFTSGMQVGTLDRSVLFAVVMVGGVFCFPYAWFRIRRGDRLRRPVEAP